MNFLEVMAKDGELCLINLDRVDVILESENSVVFGFADGSRLETHEGESSVYELVISYIQLMATLKKPVFRQVEPDEKL